MPAKAAPKRAVEEMYADAVGKFRLGELDESESILLQLLEQYPEDNKYSDNAQYYLGSVYYKRGDFHRAIEEFDKVSLNYPVGDKVPDAIYMTGLCYKGLGLADRAKTNFNKVMDNYPYSDAALKARQALEQAE
jgi:tol-pal system protein YbgF